MEQPPKPERAPSALEIAFTELRDSITREQILRFHQLLAEKNAALENEFGRKLLEAIPEWHAMVGSTYDENDVDPKYQNDTDAQAAVCERLAEVLEELTNELR